MKRLYDKVFISYIVILIVFVCFGSFLFSVGYGEIHKYFTQVENQEFHSQVQKFSKVIKNLFLICAQVNCLSSTKTFYEYDINDVNSNVMDMKGYSQYYNTLLPLNPFIVNVGTLFYKSEAYIGNDTTTQLEYMYDDHFKINSFDYESWRYYLKSEKSSNNFLVGSRINSLGNRIKTVLFTFKLPADSINKKGVLMVEFSSKEMLNQLEQDISKCGFIAIFYKNNLLVEKSNSDYIDDSTKSDFYQDIQEKQFDKLEDNKNFLFFFDSSLDSNWMLVKAIPTQLIKEQLAYIPKAISIITGIFTIIFLSIFTFLYTTTNKPYKELVRRISSKNSKSIDKGFKSLLDDIDNLYNDRKELQKITEKRRLLLKSNFTYKLLSGSFASSHDFQSELEEAEIHWTNTNYRVVILTNDIKDYENSSRFLEIFKLSMQRYMDSEILTYESNNQSIAVILSLSNSELGMIEKGMNSTYEVLNDEFDSKSFNIYIGDVKSSYSQIMDSYSEALFVKNYFSQKSVSTITYFNEICNSDITLNLPLNKESEILLFIKKGQFNKLLKSLENLFPSLETEKKWSQVYKAQFKLYIISLLLKILSMINVSSDDLALEINDFLYLQTVDNISELKSKVLSIVEKSYQNTHSAHNTKNYKILESLRNIIEENFHDYSLSVAMLSDQLGFTPGYLTTIFKEHYGVSIGNFIEEKRLTHALSLIKISSESINDVARKSGYRNMNTFYKAFKRFYGISPKEKQREYNLLSYEGMNVMVEEN